MDVNLLSERDHQRVAGARLRQAIDLLGLTYVEAAGIMGVTKHVLNHWMEGNHPMKPYPVYRLRAIKGVTFEWVFAGDFSGLPHRLAQALEAAALASLADRAEPVRKDGAPERPSSPRPPRKTKAKV